MRLTLFDWEQTGGGSEEADAPERWLLYSTAKGADPSEWHLRIYFQNSLYSLVESLFM